MAAVRISRVNEVPQGTGKTVQVNGKAIALFNINGTFYALDNACTHRGGPLGEGRLHGSIVTCPWHANQFDVTTGRVITGTRNVAAYPVRTQGDDILIDL